MSFGSHVASQIRFNIGENLKRRGIARKILGGAPSLLFRGGLRDRLATGNSQLCFRFIISKNLKLQDTVSRLAAVA